MKKLVLIAILLMASYFSNQSYAQCTPNLQYADSLYDIWPDSITNLPLAVIGSDYNTVIDIKTLTDTTSSLGAVKVYAMRVNAGDVTGLPAGFTFTPNYTGNGGWVNGGTAPNLTPVQGCVKVYAPASAVAAAAGGGPNNDGVYPILVKIDMKVTAGIVFTPTWLSTISTLAGPLPEDDDYRIKIVNSGTGFELEHGPTPFSVSQNYPNPVHGDYSVQVGMPSNGKVSVRVTDILGNVVAVSEHSLSKGNNKLNLSRGNLQAGVYFYTVTFGSEKLTRRMIVSE